MLFHKNIEELRHRINEAGAIGKTFLFAIDYEMTEGLFILDPLEQRDVFFRVKNVGNLPRKTTAPKHSFDFETIKISFAEYKEKFDTIQSGLLSGDSFLSNLTIKTKINTDLTLASVFEYSQAPYSLFVPDRFVCFSPERFVHIDHRGNISSNPMKGTIDASLPDARQKLMDSFKEKAEHNTIVDLIRNDLGRVAESVTLEQFRYIESIKTRNKEILQVSSQITGKLSPDYRNHLGDILFAMLPAGSISGAPKDATVSLIRSAEKEDRGYYTGIFGYFDGRELDSAVMIRFMEQQGDAVYYRSGGGITAYSRCEDEYNEIFDKIYLPFV